MATLLRALGQVTYNGYTFNERSYTSDFSITPVPDSSGRLVAYRQVSLTVTTTLAVTGGTTDPAVRAIVNALSQIGRPLVLTGKGFGNYAMNAGTPDMKFGPKPGRIQVVAMGGGAGVKLVWPVTFSVPPCDDSDGLGILDVSYTVSHTLDAAGYVLARTIRGTLTIPLAVKNGNKLPTNSADLYREDVEPDRLTGFLRTSGPFTLSADRTTLDFEFTDVELPGPALPPYVISIDANETVRSTGAGLATWESRLSATYQMVAGRSGFDAAAHFLQMAKYRTTQVQSRLQIVKQAGQQAGDVVPLSLEMTDQGLYGKPSASFSIGYTFSVPLPQLIAASGIWRTVNLNQTWKAWETSIVDATGAYGRLRLRFDANSEITGSLCQEVTSVLVGGGGNGSFWTPVQIVSQGGRNPAVEQQAANVVSQLAATTFPTPSPAGSWIAYENEIWVEVESGVVPVRTLPSAPLDEADDVFGGNPDIAGNPWPAVGAGRLPAFFPQAAGRLVNVPTTFARRVAPIAFVYLRGYAIRAGYPADPPRLLDVNGMPPVPATRLDRGEGFGRTVKANGGVPIHLTKWNLRYYLPAIPTDPLPVPSNPMVGQR